MLLTDARRPARTGPDGEPVPSRALFSGARDGIRTRTAVRPTRFKLVVAAGYTTRATLWRVRGSVRDGKRAEVRLAMRQR